MAGADGKKQLLHLVFGGELKTLDGNEFRDLDELDIVGIFPDYKSAAGGLEGQGAGERRQCPYALFRRPSAPAARAGQRQGRMVTDGRATVRLRRAQRAGRKKDRRDRPLKALWRTIRKPLAQSRLAKASLASLLAQGAALRRADQPAGRRIESTCRRSYDELSRRRSSRCGTASICWRRFSIRAASRWSPWCRAAPTPKSTRWSSRRFGFEAVRGSGGRDDTQAAATRAARGRSSP